MRALIRDVKLQLDAYERFKGLRKRKRSAKAEEAYADTIDAVLCDLVYRELEQPRGRLHLSQSNRVLRKASRYKGKAMGKTLPDLLKAMSSPEMGFITLVPGKSEFTVPENGPPILTGGKQTVIAAAGKLLSRIDTFGISFADIGPSDDEEVIVLRGPKAKNGQPVPPIEYVDTEDTIRLRQQLSEINSYLEQAEIELAFDEGNVDLGDRRLRRIFNNGDFRQGGRLYGGFWQTMTHLDRLNSLHIDDDSAVELDYGQTALLLLYSIERALAPSGDLYDLSEFGIPTTCRPGIKKLIQASIHSSKPLERMPKGARKTIPKTFSLAKVQEAIHQKHPLIAHRFNEALGMQLMRLESDILVDVLLTLKSKGIVALPVHDAVLVKGSYEHEALAVMIDIFRRHTGLTPEVDVVSM